MLPSFIGICHVGGGGGCPAFGTVVGTGTSALTLSYTYGNAPFTQGTFDWGTQHFDITADGTCGTFNENTTYDDNFEYHYVISDLPEIQVETRILYTGNGTYAEYQRAGIPTGNTDSGGIFQDINDYNNGIFLTNIPFGTFSSTEYHDGTGGTYWDQVNTWYDNGTYLAGAGELGSYYSDGQGGWYLA